MNGTTWVYVGKHYEVKTAPSSLVKKYYFADGRRVAMRKGGDAVLPVE